MEETVQLLRHIDYSGFTDQNCGVNINECLSNPCLNEGLCFDSVDTFKCVCLPLYTGQFCETPFDPCQESKDLVCQNGGTCEALPRGEVACNCLPGYSGEVESNL